VTAALAVVALALLLGTDAFEGGALGWIVGGVAYGAAVTSSIARHGPLRRAGLAIASLAAASAWALCPEQWPWACVAVLAAGLMQRPARAERALLALPFVVPVMLLLVALSLGSSDAVAVLLQHTRGVLPGPGDALVRGAAIVAAIAVSGSGERPGRSELWDARVAVVVAVASGGAVLMLLARRLEALLVSASIRSDSLQWSESPLLMNVLKHWEGQPIYSAPEHACSLTYAPYFELLQAAVLQPFGAELDIVWHRGLVAVWQITAAVLIGIGVYRTGAWRPSSPMRARVAAAFAAGAVVLGVLGSSPTSWYLHPDHAVNALAAGALAVVLAADPGARAVRAAAWLVTPVAAAFKLTGVGVGVGLGLLGLVDRQRAAVAAAVGGGLLAVGMVPLTEWTFPGFRAYAVDLMASHTVRLERLGDVAIQPHARVFAAATLLWAAAAVEDRRALGRALVFGVGIGAVAVLGFLKDGGRGNNLVASALVGAVVAFLAIGARAAAAMGAVRACVPAALLVLLPFRPTGDPRALRDDRARVMTDHRATVAFLRSELEAGRRPLLQSNTTAWLEAGGCGVPCDGIHPAVELYLGRHPAFERHLARLQDGTYDSIVTPGLAFTASGIAGGPFAERMRAAIAPRFCVVYPLAPDGAAVALTHGTGTLILRRRDAGCEPFKAPPPGPL
jgi:hypothetical protein